MGLAVRVIACSFILELLITSELLFSPTSALTNRAVAGLRHLFTIIDARGPFESSPERGRWSLLMENDLVDLYQGSVHLKSGLERQCPSHDNAGRVQSTHRLSSLTNLPSVFQISVLALCFNRNLLMKAVRSACEADGKPQWSEWLTWLKPM